MGNSVEKSSKLNLQDLVYIMKTVNIHQAKTHLSRLIEQAVKGEPFIIAKAGKPMVRVTALDVPLAGRKRRPRS